MGTGAPYQLLSCPSFLSSSPLPLFWGDGVGGGDGVVDDVTLTGWELAMLRVASNLWRSSCLSLFSERYDCRH